MQNRCKGCYRQYDAKYDVCPHCGYYEGFTSKEPFQLAVGTELAGRYVLGTAIGLGGFGITYKAWDKVLETAVAVKEYYPSGLVNRIPGTSDVILFSGIKRKEFEFGLDRLIREAQYMAQFNTHDNIVHVLSYFEENNTAYIVMEFLDGCTLGEYVQQNGMKTWKESVEIVLHICDALSEIHKVGIIHRDISPDNIFMCENGAVKLIDFGAARFAQNMESNYTVILKPGFAPAEQYTQISEQGPWTDVYAVGATLYYLVTGRKPEESTNRKTNDTLQEPIAINPELPQYVSDGIMKAMAIEPHLRFATISEFAAVLNKEKKVVSLKTEKRRRRIKRFVGIAALMVVLVSVVASFAIDLIHKREKTMLQDAAIEMWYVDNHTNTLGTAYAQIVEDFCGEYPNIQIEAKGFSSQAQLNSAMQTGAPSLVQVDGSMAGSIQNAVNLADIAVPEKTNLFEIVSSIFQKNGSNDCVFLKDYAHFFPAQTVVPTGFTVPVLYVNTSLVQFDEDQIHDFAVLESFMQDGYAVMVDTRLEATYRELFNLKEDNAILCGTTADFVAGDTAFFLSDTGVYSAVLTMLSELTGTPKVVEIQADKLPCKWTVLWSVAKRSEAQDAAAKRLLEYLLSETAQTKLYGQSEGGDALPLNAKALNKCCEIFDDWSFIPSITEHCVFGEMR